MHYRRARAGRPLTPAARPEPIPTDGLGRLRCAECGLYYRALGAHVARVHEMTARDYKLAHGLPLRRSLLSEGDRQARSAQSRQRVGSAGWQRLEAARDPAAASASRDPHIIARAAELRDHQASTLREAARARQHARVYSCVICGAQWCQIPGRRGPRVLCGAEVCRREHGRRSRLAQGSAR